MIDKALLSSYVNTIVTVVIAYVGGAAVSKDALVGAVVAIIMLGVSLWNEAHNSSFVSGSTEDDDGVVVPDYGNVEDASDEDSVEPLNELDQTLYPPFFRYCSIIIFLLV